MFQKSEKSNKSNQHAYRNDHFGSVQLMQSISMDFCLGCSRRQWRRRRHLLRSELLRILGRIRTAEYCRVLIVLVSLIRFLIQLIESLTSTRKVPRVLCAQMGKLWRMNIELVRMSVRWHVIRYNVHRSHFVLLLPFHPTVLEPDFDLSLGQAEGVRNLNSSSSRQVSIEVELLFQL